jgi:hypothetical protein
MPQRLVNSVNVGRWRKPLPEWLSIHLDSGYPNVGPYSAARLLTSAAAARS